MSSPCRRVESSITTVATTGRRACTARWSCVVVIRRREAIGRIFATTSSGMRRGSIARSSTTASSRVAFLAWNRKVDGLLFGLARK